MKKSLFVLTAALSFGYAAAQTAPAAQVPTLTDVPAGHWAKDAIDKIVAKGIILGYPDGTFRGTQNLTRYEAAVIIARLLDQIAAGGATTVTSDPATMTALQNAVQELAADLAALGVRVTDLEANSVSQDDFARLEARVDALGTTTGDPAALDALTQQIADVNARVDDLQANYDGLRADVDDNASSIAALNDLTVLLNNDILGLQDRVGAIETTIPDLATRADLATLGNKVTGIDTRVTTLENAPKVVLTGSFQPTYGRIGLISGTTNFDVDRLTRKTFAAGAFSIGTDCINTFSATQPYSVASGNVGSIAPYPEQCTDTTDTFSGLNLYFGIKASNLKTTTGALTITDAAINFEVNGSNNLVQFDNASVSGQLASTNFKVAYDYQNSAFKFNDYLFNNGNDFEPANKRRGVVATFTGVGLPLTPKLTVVTGSASVGVPNTTDSTGATRYNSVLNGTYYGVRAEVNPFNLGAFGINYAQNVDNRSAVGIDSNFKIGAFNLVGVYDVSASDVVTNRYNGIVDAFNRSQKAGYVQASADLGIAKIAANYRAIDPAFNDGVAGMSADNTYYYQGGLDLGNDGFTYGANVVGYGGALSTTLGPVTVAGFGDRLSTYSPSTDTTTLAYDPNNALSGTQTATVATPNSSYRTSYGVAAGANLFGLKLLGFYNNTTADIGQVYATGYNAVTGAPTTTANRSTTLHIDTSGYSDYFAYNSYFAYQNTALVPFNFSSTYGGILSHDGSAATALVKNLNFTIADAYFYNDKINDFQVYGNYVATIAGLTVTPFGRYHAFSVPGSTGNAITTADGTPAATYNSVKYGIQITSTPIAIIGKPSVALAVANSITTPGNSIAVNNTAKTELFGQAALTLNDIGIPGLVPSIGYAYYQGYNIGNPTVVSSASGGTATFSPTADRFYRSPLGGASDPYSGGIAGTNAGSTSGVFAQLNYDGFALNYGMFYYTDFKNNANNSVAQGFKINYNVNF